MNDLELREVECGRKEFNAILMEICTGNLARETRYITVQLLIFYVGCLFILFAVYSLF